MEYTLSPQKVGSRGYLPRWIRISCKILLSLQILIDPLWGRSFQAYYSNLRITAAAERPCRWEHGSLNIRRREKGCRSLCTCVSTLLLPTDCHSTEDKKTNENAAGPHKYIIMIIWVLRLSINETQGPWAWSLLGPWQSRAVSLDEAAINSASPIPRPVGKKVSRNWREIYSCNRMNWQRKKNSVPQYAFIGNTFGNEKYSRKVGYGWGWGVICSNCLESLRYFLPWLRLRNWAETKPAKRTGIKEANSQE